MTMAAAVAKTVGITAAVAAAAAATVEATTITVKENGVVSIPVGKFLDHAKEIAVI